MIEIEFADLTDLSLHPAHRALPSPNKEGADWLAFVMAMSSMGPLRMDPLKVTPQNQIVDGERRWLAARQLRWESVPVVRVPDSQAAAIIVESLLLQKHLTKGAKVYLAVPILQEFVDSAETRRLRNLKQGTKTIEKALKLPKRIECASGNGTYGKDANYDDLAARFGASPRLLDQAIQVQRLFRLAAEHKFEFQDGQELTLKEHFEPLILDSERPMGLGEVLKGCGWFVDADGKPKQQQGPPERNSYLHYFESAWGKVNGNFARWEKLKAAERERAIELVVEGVSEWPGEVLEAVKKVSRERAQRNEKGTETL